MVHCYQKRSLWTVRAQTQASQPPNFEEEKERLILKQREGVWICYGRIQGEYQIYLSDVTVLATKLVEDAICVPFMAARTYYAQSQRKILDSSSASTCEKKKVCHGC